MQVIDPVYLRSIVVGSMCNTQALERALVQRIPTDLQLPPRFKIAAPTISSCDAAHTFVHCQAHVETALARQAIDADGSASKPSLLNTKYTSVHPLAVGASIGWAYTPRAAGLHATSTGRCSTGITTCDHVHDVTNRGRKVGLSKKAVLNSFKLCSALCRMHLWKSFQTTIAALQRANLVRVSGSPAHAAPHAPVALLKEAMGCTSCQQTTDAAVTKPQLPSCLVNPQTSYKASKECARAYQLAKRVLLTHPHLCGAWLGYGTASQEFSLLDTEC